METKLVVFQDKEIRRVLHQGEWWFSIIDVIEVLSGSSIPRRYWTDLKRKLATEGYAELYEKIVQLKLISTDGKAYATDCANTETMLRIIQSIPSPKAEPFKRWLAKVGFERVQEIEDPELATARTRIPPSPPFQSGVAIRLRVRLSGLFTSPFDKGGSRGI